jgi:hypothetical protein
MSGLEYCSSFSFNIKCLTNTCHGGHFKQSVSENGVKSVIDVINPLLTAYTQELRLFKRTLRYTVEINFNSYGGKVKN